MRGATGGFMSASTKASEDWQRPISEWSAILAQCQVAAESLHLPRVPTVYRAPPPPRLPAKKQTSFLEKSAKERDEDEIHTEDD